MTTSLKHARRHRLLALPLAAALAAGCGSTVAVTSTRAVGDGSLSGGADTTAGGLAPAVGSPGSGSAGSQGGPTVGPGTGIGGAAGYGSASAHPQTQGSVTGPVSGPVRGRGFDAKTVRIGFNTLNNVSTFFSAVGAGDVSWGDMKADAQAIMADINAHGGVLGHKVVGVFHDEDVAQAESNSAASAQATCAALTEDSSVVAAAINNSFDDIDSFYGCMKKGDTPFFTAIDSTLDEAWIGKYRGFLHSMQGPSINSFGPVFMSRLAALGYFSPWNTSLGAPGSGKAKLGLLFPDHPRGHYAASLIARLAAARGVSVAPPVFLSPSVSEQTSQLQAAVLKFSSEGVTHVIDPEPGIASFMVSAEQQRYRPRYGYFSTWQFSGGAGNAPPAQLAGALGSGWQPTADTGKLPDNPAARACLGALKRGGVDYAGSPTPTVIALYICDEIRIITNSVIAGGGFSTAALNAGLGRFGPSFQPAVTLRSGFSPTRADNVGAVRDVGFNSQCSCFRYLSTRLWPV